MQVLASKAYFNVPDFENLREMVYRTAKRYPAEPFYLFKRQIKSKTEVVSYQGFVSQIEALGTALCARGVQGERLAIIGENSYRWSLAHLTNLCGLGCSVPLDKLLPPNEVEDLLFRAKPAVVYYDRSFGELMGKLAERMPFVRYFVEMDEAVGIETHCPLGQGLEGRRSKLEQIRQKERKDRAEKGFEAYSIPLVQETERFLYLSQLLLEGKVLVEQGKREYLELEIDSERCCSLIFTSGTTAQSKAVMLNHRNLCSEISGLARVVKWKPGTRTLSLLPLHHTFENTCGLLMMIFYGGTVCGCNGLRYIQKNMEDFKVNLIIGVPLLFENFYRKIMAKLQKEGALERFNKGVDLSEKLRKLKVDVRRKLFKKIHAAFGGEFRHGICGAAPLDQTIVEFFDHIGVNLLQGYGLTETSPVAAGCNHRVSVPGSVGQAIAGVEVAVACERDGEDGEILIRGPIVMQGYMGEDGTVDRSSFDEEGWFHTGDVGRIQNACLYITGRLKSMIVLTNGKKVFPEELEDLINRSHLVKESMVWGENMGEDVFVSAKLVLDPNDYKGEDGELLPEESIRERLDHLISEVNKHMPSFKYIKYYVYSFQDMVKTTTLKIKRNVEQVELKELLAQAKQSLKDLHKRNIDELKEKKDD